jgi:hypothetical protein
MLVLVKVEIPALLCQIFHLNSQEAGLNVLGLLVGSTIPPLPIGAPPPQIPQTAGNPGIISYYDHFLSTLHTNSPSTTRLGVTLAGHKDFEL